MRQLNFSSKMQTRIVRVLTLLRPAPRADSLIVVETASRNVRSALNAAGNGTNITTPNTPQALSNTPQMPASSHYSPSPTNNGTPTTPTMATPTNQLVNSGGAALSQSQHNVRRVDPWTMLEDFDGIVQASLFGGDKFERAQLRYATNYL